MDTERMLLGDHKRAVIYKGSADIQKILQAEIASEYIKRLREVQEEHGEVLVMGKSSHV
jgi:hypothetical protein